MVHRRAGPFQTGGLKGILISVAPLVMRMMLAIMATLLLKTKAGYSAGYSAQALGQCISLTLENRTWCIGGTQKSRTMKWYVEYSSSSPFIPQHPPLSLCIPPSFVSLSAECDELGAAVWAASDKV